MIQIPREELELLNFNLDAAISAFGVAMTAHASTVGEAAPVAHPLVEVAYRAGGYMVMEPPPPPPPPPLPTVEELATQKRWEIHNRAAVERSLIAPNYPQHEIDTWDQQLCESTAFAADAAAPVPLLSAMATARGWSVTDLAARVMTKAAAFAVAGGEILGTQQALEDGLDEVTADFASGTITEVQARAQIAAIAWPEGA